jgi:hypothetical protein
MWEILELSGSHRNGSVWWREDKQEGLLKQVSKCIVYFALEIECLSSKLGDKKSVRSCSKLNKHNPN